MTLVHILHLASVSYLQECVSHAQIRRISVSETFYSNTPRLQHAASCRGLLSPVHDCL